MAFSAGAPAKQQAAFLKGVAAEGMKRGAAKRASANAQDRFRQLRPCPKLLEAISGGFGKLRALSG
eukprot:2538455-Alexandrium_andersonii.AAC.1